MAFEEKWVRWMTARDVGLGVHVLRGVAWVASLGYGAMMRVRNAMYDRGILKAYSLGRPTISVGNLSTGGTGKTPVVAYLVKELQAMGKRPAVLLRGYRAVRGRSDEQMELEGMLPGVAVVANSDRVVAAQAVISADPSVDVFVLDDAFQHRRAKRDLNVVLVSARQGLTGGYVLPRGLMREPVEGMKRADVVVMTRVDQDAAGELERELKALTAAPMVKCVHAPVELELVHGAEGELNADRVVAVCALGDPAAFHRTLEERIGVGFGVRSYADHHAYSAGDVAELGALGMVVVTTGKDWVKLEPLVQGAAITVYVLRVAVEFEGNGDAVISDALRRLFSSADARP